jgi:hypothetical protein
MLAFLPAGVDYSLAAWASFSFGAFDIFFIFFIDYLRNDKNYQRKGNNAAD